MPPVEFTEEELRYLVHARSGGPCLELSAWPVEPQSLPRAVGPLGDQPDVFGPCSAGNDLLSADLARGKPAERAVAADEWVVFILDRVGGQAGKIAVEMCELADVSGDPSQRALHAWLHPGVASRAFAFGDLDDEGNSFFDVWVERSAALAPLYRRLATWWARLSEVPLRSGLWLGYEDAVDSDLVQRLAASWPSHLLTARSIAEVAGWHDRRDLEQGIVAVSLDRLGRPEGVSGPARPR